MAEFSGAGGFVDHGDLLGLLDDDHTQYQKETDFTAGSILFRGASVIAEDASNLFWDDTNNRLVVGGTSTTMTVNGVSKGHILSTHSQGGANAYEIMSHRHSSSRGSSFGGARTRGSEATPTIVAADDGLVQLDGYGFDGVDYELAASIDIEVDGTPGSNDMPGRIVFKTTPDAGVTSVEHMRITQAGNIGIGITPTAKLDVDGSAIFNESGAAVDFRIEGDTEANLFFVDGSTDRVGIGIAAPTSGLHVKHVNVETLLIEGTGAYSTIRLTADTAGISGVWHVDPTYLTSGAVLFGTSTSDHLVFRTDNADRIIIDSSGNVGIGLTVPTGQLHIDQPSSSGAKPVLRLDQSDIDDSFIDYIGTSAADGTRSISSDTTEDSAKFGAIRVEINGVTKWIRVYDDES